MSYRKPLIFLLFLSILFSPVILLGQVEESEEIKLKPTIVPHSLESADIFDQLISLDLRDMDIIDALKYLAAKINLNIVTTKAVTGRISLSVEDARIKDIFDIMLRSNSLAYVKQGDIYTIMTEEEYTKLYGENFSDTREVKVFRLKYAIPEQAFSLLDLMKSEIGRVMVDAESGNVLIMDTSDKIKQMQDALAEFEKENLVKVFSLKYADAKTIEDILRSQLDAKNVGSIKADERNNQVIVQTLPSRMEEIAKLIKLLDRQTKEVLIDAKIVKVKLSDRLDSGIEWEGIFSLAKNKGLTYLGSYPFSAVQSATDDWRSREQVLADMADSVGSIPFSNFTTSYSGGSKTTLGENMHVGMISSKVDFDIIMDLLQTIGDTRILSNPKLVVVNNQEAKLLVGERQAYVTTTTTTGQATSTLAEEVQFVDVGIQLSVTPSINDEGFITMKVKPEVSSVSSYLTTPTDNTIPIVDTSTTETTVMVQDGVTVIIGGLRKEETTVQDEQFPWLGQIPLLRFLFKSGYSKVERTELLVLLTPHIISGDRLIASEEEKIIPHISGKDYRDYQDITPVRELVSLENQVDVGYKTYREIDDQDSELQGIKGERYEPQ